MSEIFEALKKAQANKIRIRIERGSKALSPDIAPLSYSAGTVTHVGPGFGVKGQIVGDEDLQIDGTAKGLISPERCQLTAGRTVHVNASMVARIVMVKGEVQGNKDNRAVKKPGPICPRCGKTDTPRSRRSGIRERLRSLLFEVFPYRCQDCDQRFFAKRKWDS